MLLGILFSLFVSYHLHLRLLSKIYLKSLNKNYKDIIVNEDTDNFKIIGKVYMGR